MILPLPPHLGHGDEVDMKPSGVWWRCCTCPRPPHSGQTSAVVPGSQPLPLQVSQGSTRSMMTPFSQPKQASSNVMLTLVRRLSPRCGALGFERVALPPKPPPKKLPKMSPRSPKSKSMPPP